MGVKIGPCRIADSNGTHEPGEVIAKPSQELLELAESRATDPETGKAYAEKLGQAKAPEAVVAAVLPPEKA